MDRSTSARRWRTAAVFACGIVLGIVLVAPPAGAHFLPSMSHIWKHIQPKADERYVNEAEDLWAVVKADGTLQRGHGAVSAKHLDNDGVYEVVFNRSVRHCAYLATLGSTGFEGSPPLGEIGTVGRLGNAKAIMVTTYDSSPTLADAPFHVEVSCAGAKVFTAP